MEMSMMNESSFDSTANDTSSDSKVEVNVAFAVAIPIICILTVIGNLGTINAFRKIPELWEKPSELLILSLSCSDLMVGLTAVPTFAPQWITPGYFPFGENYCRIAVFFAHIFLCAGLSNLVAISFDRFLLVFKEYPQYMKMQTERRIYTCIAVIWLLSIMVGVIDVSIWDSATKKQDGTADQIEFTKYCESPTTRVTYGLLLLAEIAIPVMLVFGFSAAFFYFLRKALTKSWGMRAESQMGNQLATVSSSVEQKSAQRPMSSEQRKQYIKPAVVLSVLVSAMVVCVIPFGIYAILITSCIQCGTREVYFKIFFLFFLNAMLDPFLYAMTQRKILRFYKKLFTKCCRK